MASADPAPAGAHPAGYLHPTFPRGFPTRESAWYEGNPAFRGELRRGMVCLLSGARPPGYADARLVLPGDRAGAIWARFRGPVNRIQHSEGPSASLPASDLA